jgi:hypothetical protein
MRRFGPLLLAIALLGAALPVLAVSESALDDLDHNRRLLDKYRADPDHYARLLHDLRAFQALPADRQERMRQFDRDLHDQDPATQDRLWEVLERYTDWVGRLPETEQKSIDAAADRTDRLAVVKKLRQNDWIARLPQRDREALLKLPEDKQAAQLAEWRKEERQRRQAWRDWTDAVKSRPDAGPPPNRPARLAGFPQEVQDFVANQLMPVLSDEEKDEVKAAAANRWPMLANTILDLSNAHHLDLPGPPELWSAARAALPNVPGRVLKEFYQTEVNPELEAAMRAAADDPGERYEILRREYFKKHPEQVERWRRFQRRGK